MWHTLYRFEALTNFERDMLDTLSTLSDKTPGQERNLSLNYVVYCNLGFKKAGSRIDLLDLWYGFVCYWHGCLHDLGLDRSPKSSLSEY